MRPMLRPGSHVLRRSDDTLQIGLDPGQAVLLPPGETTGRTLDLLGSCAPLEEHPDHALVRLLHEHGQLVDANTFTPLLGGDAATTPGDAAALARFAGDEAADLVRRRGGGSVVVHDFGGPVGAGMAAELRELVTTSGLAAPAPPARSRAGSSATAVAAVVGVGEPQREALDGWVRSGTPHLLVRMTEGAATVGPFVVPGRTACLRCLDAHHADADPSWPLLVTQYATSSSVDRRDGAPEPVDTVLGRLALTWAARDLLTHAEGGRPSSWSATVRLDPRLASLETHTWLRHPDCGCSWGD